MENKQGVMLKDFNLSIRKSEVGESLTSRATLSQEKKKRQLWTTQAIKQDANSK